MNEINEHVIPQLSSFMDNQLPEQEKQAIEEHLKSCPDCEARYQEMTQLRDTLHASPVLTPPDSLYEGVLSRIEAPSTPSSTRHSWFTLGKALASVCAVTLMVWVAVDKLKVRPAPSVAPMKSVAPSAPAHAQPVIADKKQAGPSLKDQVAAQMANAPAQPPLPAQRKVSAARAAVGGRSESEPKSLAYSDQAAASAVSSVDELRGLVENARTAQPLAKRADVINQARNVNGAASQNSFAAARDSLKERAPMPQPSVQKVEPAPAQPATPADPSNDWKGISSGIAEPITIVVLRPEEWQNLWRAHYRIAGTPMDTPFIDFNTNMVIGVFGGKKPTSGYAIEIVEAKQSGDTFVVTYRETSPPPGSIQPKIPTQPFHFRAIPKTNQPIQFKKLN